jgi:hypothetical protein
MSDFKWEFPSYKDSTIYIHKLESEIYLVDITPLWKIKSTDPDVYGRPGMATHGMTLEECVKALEKGGHKVKVVGKDEKTFLDNLSKVTGI